MRWLDIFLVVLWLVALVLAYSVVSISPAHGITLLTIVAGAGVVGLGHYLQQRRKRKT